MDLAKQLASEIKRLQIETSDAAIKRELVKQLIYRRADLIAVGTKIVGVKQFDNLDVKFAFPSYANVEYPVPEGAGASFASITWTEFGFTMSKAEGRFLITDEAVIRGVDNVQWETGIRRLSEAFAVKKDENILATIDAGAGNTFTATATWDTATAANIMTDISRAVNYILSAPGVTDADIKNIAIVCPVKAWSGLLRVMEIEGVRISMFNWLRESYGISILPTKIYQTSAVALLTGADTAIHGELRPPAGIPLVEEKRHEGVGREYIVRQFFATKVVPDSSDVSTSSRIVKITGVAS